MEQINRVPPHNNNSEKSIIGAMIISTKACDKALDRLQATDFYLHAHQVIFGAIQYLSEASKKIDLVTISDRLEDEFKLDSVGGIEYLVDLSGFVPSVDNIEQYIETVKDASRRRQMIRHMSNTIELCFGDNEVGTITDDTERFLYEVMTDTTDTLLTMPQLTNKTIDNIEMSMNRDESAKIKTYFPSIDNIIGELKKGELFVLAGRPAAGKSALALNIVTKMSKCSDNKSLFISLEMPAEQLTQRLLATEGRVDVTSLRTGRINVVDLEKIMGAGDIVGGYNLVIDGNPNSSMQTIKSRIRQIKPDVVVVDYLQLLSIKAESRIQEISKITRMFKLMALELNVHIILLSQLSRDCEKRKNKRPMMSDLRDSGTIEQDADLVMFVYRDSVYSKDKSDNSAEIIISKSRSSGTGTADMYFNGDLSMFYEVEE